MSWWPACARPRRARRAITPRIAAGLLGIVRERLGEMPAGGREATLSSRELEVLRLVAQGRENSEIAEELVISLPTVKHHISNILMKLQVEYRIPGCRLRCALAPPRDFQCPAKAFLSAVRRLRSSSSSSRMPPARGASRRSRRAACGSSACAASSAISRSSRRSWRSGAARGRRPRRGSTATAARHPRHEGSEEPVDFGEVSLRGQGGRYSAARWTDSGSRPAPLR